ncbi:MAG: endonuclease VIII [Balneolaceae bacterium]|nr:endonuclease VIII [Balneolaceae bacterium]
MPEGPEIWRTADTLNDAIQSRKAEQVFFAFDELKEYEDVLQGCTVAGVEPRGKALITSFDNGLNIYSHNQLYGKWMIRSKGEKPETNRSLRLAIHTQDASAFLYSASEIQVLEHHQVEAHSYIKKLGPDVVHPDTTYKEVIDRFNSETFRNRKLTTLLLDPGFLSGIGNYLRSEILFCAGVDPDLKCKDCSSGEIEKLASYSLKLPRRSYQTGGITTEDVLVESLKREGASRKEYRHYVYGRNGKRCYKCGEVIQVVKTGGRKVYYCPTAQK